MQLSSRPTSKDMTVLSLPNLNATLLAAGNLCLLLNLIENPPLPSPRSIISNQNSGMSHAGLKYPLCARGVGLHMRGVLDL